VPLALPLGQMADLDRRFVEHVRATALFPEPGRALVAVSGGVDSVALIDLLVTAQHVLRLELLVAHVNHGIRSESTAVQQHVMALAGRFGLPCQVIRLALGADASETTARRARYEGLRAMQRETGARYLLTAHHADDQAETVLYRVLRGSGVAGLAGIAPIGPDGLVRPLLPFRRGEIEDWVRARHLPYDDDPSNRNPRHDRSWLRSELLPQLRARFGGEVDARLLALGADAARNRQAWREVLAAVPGLVLARAPGSIEVARPLLKRYHKVLSQALLRASAREIGCRLGHGSAARLCRFALEGRSGGTLELGDGWIAELAFDRLLIRRRDRNEVTLQSLRLKEGDGRLEFGPWSFTWYSAPAGVVRREGAATWVESGELHVRGWQRGDRIVPLGGVGSRKVRRVLMEARVPVAERDRYPLVVRGEDIVWIPSVCRSAVAVPEPGSVAIRLEAERRGD
jgi:tRNA(Ile)-lysidine synthase